MTANIAANDPAATAPLPLPPNTALPLREKTITARMPTQSAASLLMMLLKPIFAFFESTCSA